MPHISRCMNSNQKAIHVYNLLTLYFRDMLNQHNILEHDASLRYVVPALTIDIMLNNI